jgi:hypothetical protein
VPTLVPQQPPPPDYYAGNVGYLLDEVKRRSGELLGLAEQDLIGAFAAVGTGARRLFARLLSRSGLWLRIDSLRYAEVGDVEAALAELCEAGLVERLPEAPADLVLGLLTRAELSALFPEVRARTKPAWITRCLSRYPDVLIRARIARRHPWIGVCGRRAFATCQVLFFGGDSQDLTTFVMQDLGIHTYERYPLDDHTRPFAGRRELERYLLCRRLGVHARRLDEVPGLAPLILRAAWAPPASRMEQRARDRLLNRVGQWHERRGEFAEAQDCYGRSTSHPARERLARLLHRLGDEAGVEALLERMHADPWAPEEEDFAARFPGRRRTALPAITTCVLCGATPPGIERHALTLLTSNGGRGWHLENLLPLGLAGLTFWDEIFTPVSGAFSHPFQHGPQDLFWPDFARARRAALEARSASLCAPGAFEERVRAVFDGKRGVANRLVHWGAITAELLDALLANVPHGALANLAVHTIGNLHRARTGFPDLLVIYGPGAWELVEVKGPTDQLQPAQRVWLGTLEALSVPARVLRFRAAC